MMEAAEARPLRKCYVTMQRNGAVLQASAGMFSVFRLGVSAILNTVFGCRTGLWLGALAGVKKGEDFLSADGHR
jgi:hypothetical protein